MTEADTESSENIEALRQEYENAKQRIESQSTSIESLGSQGSSMLRVLIVLIGIMASIASGLLGGPVVPSVDPQSCALTNPCLTNQQIGIGIFITMLMSATMFLLLSGPEIRGVGYTGTVQDIQATLGEGYNSEEAYLKARLDVYQARIEDNNQVINAFEGLAATSGSVFLFSLFLLGLLIYSVIYGPVQFIIVMVLIFMGVVPLILFARLFPDTYLVAEGAHRGLLGIVLRRVGGLGSGGGERDSQTETKSKADE